MAVCSFSVLRLVACPKFSHVRSAIAVPLVYGFTFFSRFLGAQVPTSPLLSHVFLPRGLKKFPTFPCLKSMSHVPQFSRWSPWFLGCPSPHQSCSPPDISSPLFSLCVQETFSLCCHPFRPLGFFFQAILGRPGEPLCEINLLAVTYRFWSTTPGQAVVGYIGETFGL